MPQSRARAVARRRRFDPPPWLAWLALLAALIAGVEAAQAQGPSPPPTAPLLPPGAGGVQTAPLTPPPSERPDVPGGDARNGVELPHASPDPGIVAPPPEIGSTMPITPPPNTHGGDQTLVPK